ncbi:RnfABCDGE type electron transport complex subunit B [Moraxella nasibovis]|uniref:RnfABCDGE type electron transport complex subunit B n=1 Tax=Moraxella nasibovis TaxID=2904120 RepID=UPI002410A472|nr:RnfABCDGE type electron transport complex subunit B [Moraxella nasibovis]WFF37780.1 RnfABCDGE type electron transport complex subunit B [Moraxella nasibovis]
MTTARLDHLPVLFSPLQLEGLPQPARIQIAQIDEVLPQTQCGLCGHHDGCLPYAHGIVMNGEPPNLCVPGGQAVTDQITSLLNTPHHTAAPSKWRTDSATLRPIEARAVIREDDCIGCTKCIPACPVDAIIGTAKHMHSIISELCTGCELCLAPCPVDCIDLVAHPRVLSDAERQTTQNHLRRRYHQHLNRVESSIKQGAKPVVSTVESAMANVITQETVISIDEQAAKNAIAAAKLRTQIKKLNKQLSVRDDDNVRAKLLQLSTQLQALESHQKSLK